MARGRPSPAGFRGNPPTAPQIKRDGLADPREWTADPQAGGAHHAATETHQALQLLPDRPAAPTAQVQPVASSSDAVAPAQGSPKGRSKLPKGKAATSQHPASLSGRRLRPSAGPTDYARLAGTASRGQKKQLSTLSLRVQSGTGLSQFERLYYLKFGKCQPYPSITADQLDELEIFKAELEALYKQRFQKDKPLESFALHEADVVFYIYWGIHKETMSRKARSGGVKEENGEEANLWEEIKELMKELATIQKSINQITDERIEIEKQIVAKSNSPAETRALKDKLDLLIRETSTLSMREKSINDDGLESLQNKLIILIGLRESSEKDERLRAAAAAKPRKLKGSRTDAEGALESPGPPTGGSGSTTGRFKGTAGRSGSVPSMARDAKDGAAAGPSAEAPAKVEDGAAAAERLAKLVAGAEVAYKQAKPKEDGSQWIQCKILQVSELGGSKRSYRVQDLEPDDTGAPGDIYRATAAALIAIPARGAALPDFPVGKHVLALYPDTSTFYRAEVIGLRRDVYKLKFEDDMNQENEVDRRYVLEMNNK